MDELGLLARLLRRPSPSGHEGPAVEEFLQLGRELGFAVRRDGAGNGHAAVGHGGPRLMFLGHIDTVPGDRPVRRQGGSVHGRGAVDAKGALAAALLAGRGFPGPGTLEVVAAVREETDSAGARHLLRGRPPDAVIAGEPSGWDGVTIGYKGDLRFEATFRRPRAHWSGPEPTAADVALTWWAEARPRLTAPVAESPFRSLSSKVVGLATDSTADPEEARLTVDVRIPPGLDVAGLRARLPRGPRIRVIAALDPVERPRDDPVVRALGRGIRSSGGVPTLYRKSGTSDLNLVLPRWKVAGAAYGPGDSRLDHTNRELLSGRELRASVKVLDQAFAGLGVDLATLPRSASVP